MRTRLPDQHSFGTQTDRDLGESGRAGSPSTEAESLLKALRNVIIPFVRPADGASNDNVQRNALGPDGEEFIIALQKFMTSFLRSHQSHVGGVEVEFEEKGDDISNAKSPARNISHNSLSPVPPDAEPLPDSSLPEGFTTSQESLESYEVLNEESSDISEVSSIASMDGENADTLDRRRQQCLEKVLDALRDHVFNIMPIRLLCFTPDASKLRITLLERSEIYTHIASNVKNSFDFSELSSERVEDPRFIKDFIHKYSKYAILSHTWLRGSSEVTYDDWIRGESSARHLGYHKLLNFCKAAWKDHRVAFGWMDTVCINKESSAELDESIRSMYKWYRDAYVCITYLAGTKTISEMHKDPWFTRGWTLQELLAPSHIKFYNTHWHKLSNSPMSDSDGGDSDILKQIKNATRITESDLTGPLEQLSISRRMQMAANRQVTREEDIAYCLMGIFDVGISIAYGEGSESAFSRLLKEIFSASPEYAILDMLNWAGPFAARISNLLPRTPQGYLHCASYEQLYLDDKPIEPIILTNVGLRITMVLMPAISIQNPAAGYYGPMKDYHAMVNIAPTSAYTALTQTMVEMSYSVLDARVSKVDGWKKRHNWYQLTLGVLNVIASGDDDSTIMIPCCCFAVGLHCSPGSTSKIPTEAPIVFTLNNFQRRDEISQRGQYHIIKRSELGDHGMKLVTLDL